METKGKNNKKYKNIDRKRAMIVAELVKKHKVSERFVRLAINRERDSDLSDKIYKEYTKKYAAVNYIINN